MKRLIFAFAAMLVLMALAFIPAVPGAQASESCPPPPCPPPPCGEVTRTPGFWKTHYDFTAHIFEVHLGGNIDLGWKQLDSIDDVMGMLWANTAKDSMGDKRDKLCQARVITSYQAVAAILNSGLDNGAPLPVSLSEIASILAGTDIEAIKMLGEDLDYYNNSGTYFDIEDAHGYAIGSADPKAGNSADVSIADCY